MRDPQKIIKYRDAAIIFLVVLILTAFCRFVDFSLMIPMVFLFLGSHLFFFKKASISLFVRLGFILSLLLFGTNFIIKYTDISPLYVPVASVAMLTVLLFNDLQLGFLMSLASSLLVSLMIGKADLHVMITFFIGSLMAIYSSRNARTPGKLISSAFYVGLMQVICAALLFPDLKFLTSAEFALDYIKPLFISGMLLIFVVNNVTLKIFEYLFGVVTNYTLLELSDFNQPFLKRMIIEAPGTYHHSIVVSNLSEAAADAIGANSLLSRVGAYYHDIGKMEKPEYFTENQLVGGNKHDNIEPSISRLVILNHVKEGIEMARKSKMDPSIIDFISQHHGTSLMHYFYQRALEDTDDQVSVKEANYRYPGPKPQTRETAIVLLADSVEAATRSLDEPSPKKIEEMVRKVINNKFIDGQLDECNLTLREIELIALTFTRVLGAIYHSRVKYPEKKNGDNRDNKSTEKNPSESSQDNQSSKEDT